MPHPPILRRVPTAVVVCTAIAAFSLSGFAQQSGPYKIVDHWAIGGSGGWDYLLADPSAHRLYVTHGQRVEVLDTTSGKVVGAITGLKGTHGVALNTDGKTGYVSDGQGNDVVVFDRHDLHTIATIPTGANPDGILFEPSTKSVWAFNGRSNDASVIDAVSNKIVATIKLPGRPEFPVADGKGTVYVNIENTNSIVRLDARAKTVTATWKLDACDSPSGLAIDEQHRRLFPVCDGKKMGVIDADSGKQLASPAIGDGPDAAGFSAKYGLAFASAGDGTLTVIDTANGNKVLQTLATERGARTMTYDPTTDRVYLATAKFGPRPEPTAQTPRPRPSVLPDSFQIIVVGRK